MANSSSEEVFYINDDFSNNIPDDFVKDVIMNNLPEDYFKDDVLNNPSEDYVEEDILSHVQMNSSSIEGLLQSAKILLVHPINEKKNWGPINM